MCDLQQQNADDIRESSAARTAYHLAAIPIIGLLFYAALAFLALYQIGSQGRSGLFLLSKGFWRMCRMTFVGLVGAAAIWFCPEHATETDILNDSLLPSFMKYKSPWGEVSLDSCSGFGLVIRDLSWPPKRVKVGQWFYYDGNFNLIKKCNYWFGKEDGKVFVKTTTWFPSILEYETVKGICHGNFKYSYITIEPTTIFANGSERIVLNDNKIEAQCSKGYLDGVVKYFIDNRIKSEFEVQKGQLRYGDITPEPTGKNGKYQEWDDKQKLIVSGNYKNDIRHGFWKEWYSSGQKRSEENYVEGKLDGKVTYWFDNGQKREEGEYNNGIPVKQWKHWDEKGELVLEENYDEKGKLLNANQH